MQEVNIDIEEIMNLIPHRYPFLFVDKIISLKVNESAIGVKNVTANEAFFTGHFPKKKVMPGVLIIEALAQTAGILVSKSKNFSKDNIVYFTSIEEAKFKKVVTPGDQVHLHVTIVKNKLNLWKIDGVAKVNDQIVSEAKLSAMVV